MVEAATNEQVESRKKRRELERYPAHEAPNSLDWWVAWEGNLLARIEQDGERIAALQQRVRDRENEVHKAQDRLGEEMARADDAEKAGDALAKAAYTAIEAWEGR